jgi:hypothetical protein
MVIAPAECLRDALPPARIVRQRRSVPETMSVAQQLPSAAAHDPTRAPRAHAQMSDPRPAHIHTRFAARAVEIVLKPLGASHEYSAGPGGD